MSLLVIAALSAAGAVALLLFALLSRSEERAEVRAALSTLGDPTTANMRQRELMVPLSQRVLAPIGKRFVGLSRRFMPVGYLESVRRKLIVAGKSAPEELDRFRALRVLTVAVAPVVFGVVYIAAQSAGPRAQLVGALLASVAVVIAPDVVLNRQMAERQHAIRVQLPDVLDLLTISVEAGLGFEQALDRTVAAVPGPLSDEFLRMLGELRAGASRADALRHLDARTDVPEVRSFVLAILQADTFGVSIGRALRAQSDEIRVKRRQLAQEEAQKAPVKMLFPTVICILPALFVVVIGPAVINIARGLAS